MASADPYLARHRASPTTLQHSIKARLPPVFWHATCGGMVLRPLLPSSFNASATPLFCGHSRRPHSWGASRGSISLRQACEFQHGAVRRDAATTKQRRDDLRAVLNLVVRAGRHSQLSINLDTAFTPILSALLPRQRSANFSGFRAAHSAELRSIVSSRVTNSDARKKMRKKQARAGRLWRVKFAQSRGVP